MSYYSAGFAFFFGMLLMFFFWHRVKQFFCWLKGSRMTHYLGTRDISPLRSTDATPEELARIAEPGVLNESVIEISRGPFRRRSAIYYGKAQWQIQKDWHEFGLDLVGADRVSLTDIRGLLVETALHLIKIYPSLQAMLNRIAELDKKNEAKDKRIAELEKERDEQRSVRRSLEFGIQALLKKIEADRQRFRSEPAKRIKHCLKELRHLVTAYLNGHPIDLPKSEADWDQEFERYLQYGVAK